MKQSKRSVDVTYLVFLFLLAFVTVNAWVGVIVHNPNEDNLAHCFTQDYGLGAMTNNEEKRVKNECAIARCNEDRSIQITGCTPILILPPCKVLQGNMSKPVPDCCYEIECPESQEFQ